MFRMGRCVMPGCGNKARPRVVGLHKLGDPSKDRFLRWQRFLRLVRKDRRDYTQYSTICTEHFSIQDVINYDAVLSSQSVGYVL